MKDQKQGSGTKWVLKKVEQLLPELAERNRRRTGDPQRAFKDSDGRLSSIDHAINFVNTIFHKLNVALPLKRASVKH